ncbi:MAG: Bifunctional IPC transferase and DIPP synthase [Candidatus Moanabacter tarae]|uniref:Bifunctional IPC transferase and DIPP synthase n=1 Tax=Candidatus Moanibacter tarae TaxID=2200854 RepID=A0A2Z4AM55_9BACT|nr:MAG: Bifunctional IPC transferase and DIPP synthase [Candidatus Moanabacter tarae]|tara:strand:+ start:1587 stop:2837 length:1251 start_codon:yes stop_codon:yes gene_type:complete
MIAIIYKFPGDAWVQLGGMSVLERNLRSLDKINIEKVRIVLPPGEYPPTISIPRPLGIKQEIVHEKLVENNLLSTLGVAFPKNSESALIFHANLLTDPRIFIFLAGLNCAFFSLDPDATTPQKNWRIALLRFKDLEKVDELWEKVDLITQNDIASYDTEVRGEVDPYCLGINSPEKLHQGWEILIRRSQKRPGDFIEKYVHPDIQNWIVKRICDTSITPNQISFIVIACAVAGAILFYHGLFLIAWILAFSATILDGVDGKLARVKLMTSKLGKFEHIFDYFGENAWYLCLARNLALTSGPSAWLCGIAISACDTVDRIIAAFFEKRMKITLDEYSLFDRDFRLIGGRKTIYLFFLLVGFFSDSLYSALKISLAWAIFTVFIHATRSFWHFRRAPRVGTISAIPEQAKSSSDGTGT